MPSVGCSRKLSLGAGLVSSFLFLVSLASPVRAVPVSFAPKADYATGSAPISVAIADLNGGGKPDLAVAYLVVSTVSVLLGNVNGTFGPKADFATGSAPSSVAIADLNGDGKPDLAVANSGVNTVSVLLGNGNGTFGAKTD